MEKTSLVSAMTYSEVTSFLEKLSSIGIGPEAVDKFRKNQLPAVFERQLERVFNTGTFGGIAEATFSTFIATLGSPEFSVMGKVGKGTHVFFEDHTSERNLHLVRDISTQFPVLGRVEHKFVVLTRDDMFGRRGSSYEKLLTNKFLSDWSNVHLAGMRLQLCRADAPLYVTPHFQKFIPEHMDSVLICTDPADLSGCNYSIMHRGDSLYLHRGKYRGPVEFGKMIFGYEAA